MHFRNQVASLNCSRRIPPLFRHSPRRIGILGLVIIASFAARPALADPSVARKWDEQLLHAISLDTARPTVHARNLFHLSAAMYDAWAAYDATAAQYLHHENATAANIELARNEA